jgi:ATP-dependent DNA ligase
VRLFPRNGHNWTGRYSLIVEAALRSRARLPCGAMMNRFTW